MPKEIILVSLLRDRALAWSQDSSALSPTSRGLFFMAGVTVGELALLMLLLKTLPKASARHVRALLCIMQEKNNYLSLEEIEKNTLIGNGELRKIMHSFAQNQLVQKEGCLYRKPGSEKIVEII